MKPQILAATLFASVTLIAGIAWSLSCIVPVEVETTTLEIVSATVDGEEVGLTRYQSRRAPTLQAEWSRYCGDNERRPVVWIGSDLESDRRVAFESVECGEQP